MSEKSRHYEQYLISKKLLELKSTYPNGTNKKNAGRVKTCNDNYNATGTSDAIETFPGNKGDPNGTKDFSKIVKPPVTSKI